MLSTITRENDAEKWKSTTNFFSKNSLLSAKLDPGLLACHLSTAIHNLIPPNLSNFTPDHSLKMNFHLGFSQLCYTDFHFITVQLLISLLHLSSGPICPSASGGGWEHSVALRQPAASLAPSRELGGQGTVTWTGESHWGPGGSGDSGLTAGVGTTQFPAPGYLNTIHRYGREQWDYTTCHWSMASGPVTSQAEASQGPSMPQEVRLLTPIESL